MTCLFVLGENGSEEPSQNEDDSPAQSVGHLGEGDHFHAIRCRENGDISGSSHRVNEGEPQALLSSFIERLEKCEK